MSSFIKVFVIIGAIVTGIVQWKKHHEAAPELMIPELAGLPKGAMVLTPPPVKAGEFTSVTPPANMPEGKVFIVAPACGNEADLKANELERRLQRAGIPYARTAEVKFSSAIGLDNVLKVQAVMNQPLPLVFVRNRAQSNPSPEEVLAEVRMRR